jgi:hypothetical protein
MNKRAKLKNQSCIDAEDSILVKRFGTALNTMLKVIGKSVKSLKNG